MTTKKKAVRMNLQPEYSVLARNDRAVLIRDLAEEYQCQSVTNGAEKVVKQLYDSGTLGDRRLFYIDTMGTLDELGHDKDIFTGFIPGDIYAAGEIFGQTIYPITKEKGDT